MAVGLRRRNPYGAPNFFGYDAQDDFQPVPADQFAPSFGDFVAPEPEEARPQLLEPVEQAKKTDDAPGFLSRLFGGGDEMPTEASIERRMRLAKALMGQQQDVGHPLQAVGNAVNQIAGAYLENRAGREQEKIEKGRREAMKTAFGDGGDVEALIERMLASDDPAIVDQGLQMKLQLAMAQMKGSARPLKPQQVIMGDQLAYLDEEGNLIEGLGGPRYKPEGEGGGAVRSQQGGWVVLPDGRKVFAEYIPNQGMVFRDTDGQVKPIPQGTSPTTASQGGYLNAKQFLELKKDRNEGVSALQKLKSYFNRVGNLDAGFQRWAQDVSGKFKTFLGQQNLTPEEFNIMEAKKQQQALIGLFRVTIVGPGIVTEYDAYRIIEAMGGDPGSALQNPEVVRRVLESFYRMKLQETQVLQQEYERNAPIFGETPNPLGVPDTLTGPEPGGEQAPQTKLPGGVPSKDKRVAGKTEVVKGGVTYVWTGTGWRRKQ